MYSLTNIELYIFNHLKLLLMWLNNNIVNKYVFSSFIKNGLIVDNCPFALCIVIIFLKIEDWSMLCPLRVSLSSINAMDVYQFFIDFSNSSTDEMVTNFC